MNNTDRHGPSDTAGSEMGFLKRDKGEAGSETKKEPEIKMPLFPKCVILSSVVLLVVLMVLITVTSGPPTLDQLLTISFVYLVLITGPLALSLILCLVLNSSIPGLVGALIGIIVIKVFPEEYQIVYIFPVLCILASLEIGWKCKVAKGENNSNVAKLFSWNTKKEPVKDDADLCEEARNLISNHNSGESAQSDVIRLFELGRMFEEGIGIEQSDE